MRATLFSLITVLAFSIVDAARTWELPIEYAVDREFSREMAAERCSISESSYAPLGTIELSMQYDGNYTGRFVPDRAHAADLHQKLVAKPTSYYRVRSGDVFSSNVVSNMM